MLQWKCADLDTSTLPSFSLMLDGNWFEVTPDDYVRDVDGSSEMCTFCIYETYSSSSLDGTSYSDTVMLGKLFLEDWYTTLDFDSAQVGFTALTAGSRSSPVSGSTPTLEMPEGVSLVEHDLIALITVPLGIFTFSAGFWTAYRAYQYFVVGDDKFWVFPWN